MADKQISQLVEATSINGEDLFVMQQGGTAKKLSGQRLSNYVYSSAAEQIERVNETVAEAQEAVDELEEQKNTIAQTIADMAELGTDTTLTTPGMAADAKTVGDRIEGIEDIAEADLELVSAKPGNIVSFYNGTDDVPVKSLKLNIDPVQDLHGYANPWPAGGGKNLLDTSSFVNGTYRGITVTVQPDGSFLFNGTANEAGGINLGTAELEAGSYAFTGITDGDTSTKYYLNFSGLVNVTTAERTYTVEETTGTVCSFQLTPGVVINNLIVRPMIRLTTQSDTYEPYSNICPITGFTGANVTRAGKNLISAIESGGRSANGLKYDSSIRCVTDYIPIKSGKTYILSYRPTNISKTLRAGIQMRAADKHTTFDSSWVSSGYVFTARSDSPYLTITFSYSNDSDINPNEIIAQLELGSTATDYEPYSGTTYSIEFPSEAGTVYGGTLDVTTGLLTVDRASVDLGSLTWDGYSLSYNRAYAGISNIKNAAGSASPPTAKCSALQVLSIGAFDGDTTKDYTMCVNNNNHIIWARVTSATSSAEYKTALTGVQLVYLLDTPVTYQLSPIQVRTLLGENHLWADTGDITELIYRVLPDPKVVENADQLLSDTGTIEKVPYLFRKTGGDMEHVSRLTDKIVGGTIAWNQLVKNGNFANADTWSARQSTVSVTNNIATVTPSSDGTLRGLIGSSATNTTIYKGHKYILAISVLAPIVSQISLSFGGAGISVAYKSTVANEWTRIEQVWRRGDNESDVSTITPYALVSSSLTTSQTVQFKDFVAFDLTQMFGSAVADQIYAMEAATAGAGVAFFKSLFPKPYYAYNAGELISVNTSAHVTRGFNQWDEEWEVGTIDANGNFTTAINMIRSKNYIPCFPSTAYRERLGNQMVVYFYDKNKTMIPYTGSGKYQNGYNGSSGDFITPQNACYMRFRLTTDYGINYKHDVCINISKTIGFPKNGDYAPYEGHTYLLDSSLTLRGTQKLDAYNKVYYDGDTYEADGTVTRWYGVVDLGTLNWSRDTTTRPADSATIHAFYATLSEAKINNSDTEFSVKLAGYTSDAVTNVDYGGRNSVKDKLVGGADGNHRVWVYNSAYNDYTATEFKSAISGSYLVYALATPTTETAYPFTNPQICSPYGTEEYVDEREVAVPVGHDTFYHEDLKGKIEGLPWDLSMIAPVENGATASQAYAQGKFFMRNNQFCKAKTSIASGASFTLGTNYEVTTVAAELFSALS